MLGENIKRYRKGKMTQKQLAHQIGVTAATVTKYENNNIEPSVDMLKKIATVLDVNIVNLLGANPGLDLLMKYKDKQIDQQNINSNNAKAAQTSCSITINELCSLLNLNPNKIGNKINFDESLSKENFEKIKDILGFEIDETEEAFLYANYVYKTNNDIFKIIEFYYYLLDNYGSEYLSPNNVYVSSGTSICEKLNIPVDLGFALDYNTERLVNFIISHEEEYIKLLTNLYLLNNKEYIDLGNMSHEDIYNVFFKVSNTLNYEIYKIENKSSL